MIYDLAAVGGQTLWKSGCTLEEARRNQKALAMFRQDVTRRRAALKRCRIAALGRISAGNFFPQLAALKKCDACGWEWGSDNPLFQCTRDFGCALECLRTKSDEWRPGILKF